MPTTTRTPKQALDEAFQTATREIAKDIPMIAVGVSGVVADAALGPEATQLVAALTVQYMGKLVDAGMDCHEHMRVHHHQSSQQRPPPPVLPRKRAPATPPPPPETTTDTAAAAGLAHHQHPYYKQPRQQNSSKKNYRGSDFWDEPLPEVKSTRDRQKYQQQQQRPSDDNIPADKQQQQQQASSSGGNDDDDDNVDEAKWVGAAGVDFWEESQRRRARAVYFSHHGLTAQNVLFPICHDSYMYGKIRQVTGAKLAVVQPILQDPIVEDMITAEARQMQIQQDQEKKKRRQQNERGGKSKSSRANIDKEGGTSDPEEEEDNDRDGDSSAESEEGPTWPGLDRFLPAYRNYDNI